MHRGYSWDDLRFLLAVARAGTLSGAARSLGVNHTTVSRRIQALEEHVGVRLFERLSSGWATTWHSSQDLAAKGACPSPLNIFGSVEEWGAWHLVQFMTPGSMPR